MPPLAQLVARSSRLHHFRRQLLRHPPQLLVLQVVRRPQQRAQQLVQLARALEVQQDCKINEVAEQRAQVRAVLHQVHQAEVQPVEQVSHDLDLQIHVPPALEVDRERLLHKVDVGLQIQLVCQNRYRQIVGVLGREGVIHQRLDADLVEARNMLARRLAFVAARLEGDLAEAVLPVGILLQEGEANDCLLTVSFHMLVVDVMNLKESIWLVRFF